jgi:hypothetical protein
MVFAGYTDGYPVVVDMSLDGGQASRLHRYLHEGNFLRESRTQRLHAFLLVRSAMLRAVGSIHMSFQWVAQGRISMQYANQVRGYNSAIQPMLICFWLRMRAMGCTWTSFCMLQAAAWLVTSSHMLKCYNAKSDRFLAHAEAL